MSLQILINKIELYLIVWNDRFKGILEYGDLKDRTGYKIYVYSGLTELEEPSYFQFIKRWYYGQSYNNLLLFINKYGDEFIDDLYNINDILKKYYEKNVNNNTDIDIDNNINNNIHKNKNTLLLNGILKTISSFSLKLRHSFLICKDIYPNNDDINQSINLISNRILNWNNSFSTF